MSGLKYQRKVVSKSGCIHFPVMLEISKAGGNKKITWTPANDSVFLNEMVFIEVKAEKYVKSFKKRFHDAVVNSIARLGQTKISNGKPWWLTGIVS